MRDDRTLVAGILNGDKTAFRTLIRQNERLVFHMIGRLIDSLEEREELGQDVFMRVYEKLGEFTFQSRLSTWIATIAYRHAINHLRKKKIKISEFPDDSDFENQYIAEGNPEQELEDQDLNQQVMGLIELLPVQYKTVLTLYHIEHMTYPEIGEITGMPEGTVKNYLFRARNLLKDKVKKYLGKEEVL